MLTALARCCSAALTPTFSGSTSRAMSRSVPACRAVIVLPLPPSAAIATPRPRSPAAVVLGPGPTGATGMAAGRRADLAAAGGVGEDDDRLGGEGMVGLQMSSHRTR